MAAKDKGVSLKLPSALYQEVKKVSEAARPRLSCTAIIKDAIERWLEAYGEAPSYAPVLAERVSGKGSR